MAMLMRNLINLANQSFLCSLKSAIKPTVQVYRFSHQNFTMSKTSSKKMISSSSSFEKVLESPFTLKDLYGSSTSREISRSKKGSKKSRPSAKVKIKARSAPAGRKLRRKKSRGTSPQAKPSNHISRKSYMLSPTSPPQEQQSSHTPTDELHPAQRTTPLLAKIDSPDLRLTNSMLKNNEDQHGTMPFKQPKKASLQSIVSSKSIPSALKTSSNKSKKLSSQSSASVSFKPTVKLSRNFSSNPPVMKHNSARLTRKKNPFSFHREITGSSSYDGHKFTIYELAQSLRLSKFKKIVIMSGAGISTDSGIPDFRYAYM